MFEEEWRLESAGFQTPYSMGRVRRGCSGTFE
jgi:hypothetical protein